MTVTVALLFVFVVACAVIALIVWPNAGPDVAELCGARCVLNESTLKINHPIPLTGRVDRVWALKGGLLVITDTKRRLGGRIYVGDRVQLSAYKLLLKNTHRFRGRPIADYGYLQMTGRGKNARYVKVPLMSEDEIITRYRRAITVKADRVQPRPNPSRGLCAGCGHRQPCAAAI